QRQPRVVGELAGAQRTDQREHARAGRSITAEHVVRLLEQRHRHRRAVERTREADPPPAPQRGLAPALPPTRDRLPQLAMAIAEPGELEDPPQLSGCELDALRVVLDDVAAGFPAGHHEPRWMHEASGREPGLARGFDVQLVAIAARRVPRADRRAPA